MHTKTCSKHQRASSAATFLDEIDWSHRLIGIKGFRGVGKTSFLLDYLRELKAPIPKTVSTLT
jgi:uncharacterized protein